MLRHWRRRPGPLCLAFDNALYFCLFHCSNFEKSPSTPLFGLVANHLLAINIQYRSAKDTEPKFKPTYLFSRVNAFNSTLLQTLSDFVITVVGKIHVGVYQMDFVDYYHFCFNFGRYECSKRDSHLTIHRSQGWSKDIEHSICMTSNRVLHIICLL